MELGYKKYIRNYKHYLIWQKRLFGLRAFLKSVTALT